MLIGPDFPASIRFGRSRIAYVDFPDCYPYEVALKLLGDAKCFTCERAILECDDGKFFVDLDSHRYCSSGCLPLEIRQRLLYQPRVLYYHQTSVTVDDEDNADE